MRKPDPFTDTGLIQFPMPRGQASSIKPGALVTIEEKTGRLRLATPDEPVRTFKVPEGANVEGAYIAWRQDQPIKPLDHHLLKPAELSKFQLARRIEHHMPAIETSIGDSRELERRDRIEAKDESGLAFIRGPRHDHRGILRRLQEDLTELVRRLRAESRQS